MQHRFRTYHRHDHQHGNASISTIIAIHVTSYGRSSKTVQIREPQVDQNPPWMAIENSFVVNCGVYDNAKCTTVRRERTKFGVRVSHINIFLLIFCLLLGLRKVRRIQKNSATLANNRPFCSIPSPPAWSTMRWFYKTVLRDRCCDTTYASSLGHA